MSAISNEQEENMQLEAQIAKIKRRMDVAHKQAKADLVIRNANLVNVFLTD